jgi:SAM-dependent methyltransferase
MVLLENEKWIEPAELKKQLVRDRQAVDSGVYDPYGSDFTAYYAYRKGISRDYIVPHAMVADRDALDYVLDVEKRLARLKLNLKGELLDVGCAIGTITNALARRNPGGRTSGLDISDDAIAVARAQYPHCSFHSQAADDPSVFPDGYFDLIHAREFYPFTRTDDLETHRRYLDHFLRKLKPRGIIVLSMVKRGKGFFTNYKELAAERRGEMLDLGEHPLMMKTYRRMKLPLWLGDPLTYITNRLLGRETSYLWVFRKASNAEN